LALKDRHSKRLLDHNLDSKDKEDSKEKEEEKEQELPEPSKH